MREPLHIDVSALPSSLSEEALSCLVNLVAGRLGASAWTPGFERQVTSLHRGFSYLAQTRKQAAQWRDALTELLKRRPEIASEEGRRLTDLAMHLEMQPKAMPPAYTGTCLALGALSFARLAANEAVSLSFVAGLGQLFTSNKAAWACARRQLVDAEGPAAAPADLPRSVSDFLAHASALLAEPLCFPILIHQCAERAGADTTTAPARGQSQRPVPVFDPEPCLYLQEVQMHQQEHEPALNSYLLQNDWNALTSAEFNDCCRILVELLRTAGTEAEPRARRLYAACALLSMLCELSLENTATLPLGRTGSLHLDLSCGLLRRDSSVINPRTDREKNLRWIRRWWRTPVPPEILNVLREAASLIPQARSIGDLLLAEGLNPPKCHELLNSKRTEARVYESLRVGRSLRAFLLGASIHPSVVSRCLGDVTVVPRSQHYYLLLDQGRITYAVDVWCVHIGLVRVTPRSEDTKIGSPKALCIPRLKLAFQCIQHENHADQMSITTRSDFLQVIGFSNRYVARFALHMLSAQLGRCQMLSSITCAALLADEALIWLADRASDRYAERRVCVLTPVQRRERLFFIEHLRAVSARAQQCGQVELASKLRVITSGASPEHFALPIIFKNREDAWDLRCVTRADLRKTARNAGLKDLNVARHSLITELVRREVPAVAIDAQVGHHQPGAPTFGVGSGLSIQEFAGYMVGVLAKIHDELDYQPVRGLGTSNLSRLKLPEVRLPESVPMPDNGYLKQRIEAEDFNPPDRRFAEEDCPVSPYTLAARRRLSHLCSRYLSTEAVARFPAGAVCFCIVVFDFAINAHDASSFLNLLAGNREQYAGRLTITEVCGEGGKPKGQRILACRTMDALKLARTRSANISSTNAVEELRNLLNVLDPDWPDCAPTDSLHRLQALVAHALLIDLSPIARFCIFHKAPFIPAADLQRIQGQNSFASALKPVRQYRPVLRTDDFSDQVSLIKKAADRDESLGEYRARANKLLDWLAAWEVESPADEAQLLLNELIRAEVGRAKPPFRRIGIPLLAQYTALQVPFFKRVRDLGRLPQNADEWEGLTSRFSGEAAQADPTRRWAGLHLAAWIESRGLPVPSELGGARASTPNFAPHLSVYVTKNEVSAVAQVLEERHRAPRADWVAKGLFWRRLMGLRPQEERYLKAGHASSDGRWLFVTTSGHIHLKNQGARGLVSVPFELRREVLEQKARRCDSPWGRSAGMLVAKEEKGFGEYDALCAEARDLLRALTGRSDLRLYDLRACAVSDLISGEELLGLLHQISSVESCAPRQDLSAEAIGRRYKRGAYAAREARQTSVVTALRYYHLGGLIEARREWNQALATLTDGGKYLAAITMRDPAAIYSQRYRDSLRKRLPIADSARRGPQQIPDAGRIGAPPIKGAVVRSGPEDANAVTAGLLLLSGLSISAAGDYAGLKAEVVQKIASQVNTIARRASIDALSSRVAVAQSPWFEHLRPIAEWAVSHRDFFRQACSRPFPLAPSGSVLKVRESDAVFLHPEVWATCKKIHVIYMFSATASMEVRSELRTRFTDAGVLVRGDVLKRSAHGVLQFLPRSGGRQPDLTRLSNHALGKFGRLVVAAIALTCMGDLE